MPVDQRGGPGRETLYNPDEVRAWLARTGRGMRCNLRQPLAAVERKNTEGTEARCPREDLLLGRILEQSLGSIVALFCSRGIPGSVALAAMDDVIVVAYQVLERCTGRAEGQIPMDGALRLMLEDDGRAQILELVRPLAAEIAMERASWELGREARAAAVQ